MKKFKKVIALGLAAMAAVSAMSVTAMATGDNSSDVLAMSAQETRSRGFEVINGDIYDLNGNLLIDLTDGKMENGFTIDPDFKVHSEAEYVDDNSSVMPFSINNPIFDGTIGLNLNTTGNEGKQVGSSTKATSSDNICKMKYVSGYPSGVNFCVMNITKGTAVDWYPNVKANNSVNCPVYNSSRPNDTYVVYASAEGTAGSAHLLVYLY